MTDISKKQQIVMDVRVHAVTMEDALEWAKEAVLEGKPRMIATANAEMIMIAQKDPELKEILNTCDLVVPDGAGVLWAGEKLGTPFPERVAGADLAEELLKIASEKSGRYISWEARRALPREPQPVSWNFTFPSSSQDAMKATSIAKKRKRL